ncbi:metallophosphoesterase [Utexia brackfieldae]|uniref:metallophosphoesterase n=1 Tax=Utexia brackfieldae TaxID=3074108 RepID=UPI00370DE1CF
MGWFLVVSICISLLLVVYVGSHLLFLFQWRQKSRFFKIFFWLGIIVSGFALVIGRMIAASGYVIPLCLSYLFAFFLCLFLSCLIFDVIILMVKCLTGKLMSFGRKSQLCFLLLVFAIFGHGLYMANMPNVVYYKVTIAKPSYVRDLRIVQVSDVHISELTSTAFVEGMVKRINQRDPDYIFITGDTLDIRLKPFIDKNMASLFAKLKSTYGTIIVLGNHEYYGVAREKENSEQAIVEAFSAGNMLVLKDEVLYSAETDSYIIGRRDRAVDQLISARAPLSDLMAQTVSTKPIFLLDHQPYDLNEPASAGVDIMFSGHTHGGQIFPVTLLISLMYENAWGMLQKVINQHQFTSIVSRGYGFWGPPIRLMSRAEIAVTDIRFQPE